MGKTGKRKKRSLERERTKRPALQEKPLTSSILERYSFIIPLFLISITALLIYSNTFSSAFQFDDTNNIVENYKLRDISNLWPPSGTRYIGFLSFAFNYHFGELNVFGYHIVNIIIHIINSLLVWYLILLTFETPVMERTTTAQSKNLIALTAALIFVSHPIQTQAVTYIVQRFTSLATLFYLLSLVLYIKARLSWIKAEVKAEEDSIFSTSALAFYLLSLISAVLAMKTKEISFTLPFIIVLYEFMFLSNGHGLRTRLLYLTPLLLTILIIPLTIIGTDKPLGDIIGELREAAQETEVIPRGVYLLTQFRVIVTYIRLLFLPIAQNLDYDYPLYRSLFGIEVFLSFLFLLSIFALAIYLFIRLKKIEVKSTIHNPQSAIRLTSFGIFWFFITLSIESSVIPIRDVIFEHRLYLPSVGFVLVGAVGLYSFIVNKIHPLPNLPLSRGRLGRGGRYSVYLYLGLILLITTTAGIAAYQRNKVWRDEFSLWKDVVDKSPGKARPHNNLCGVYGDLHQYENAIKACQIALRLKPDYAEANNNLGLAYASMERLQEAIQKYLLALKLKPDYPEAYNNLGSAYYKFAYYQAAIKEYLKALQIKPDYPEAHNNLGSAYYMLGYYQAAIKEYQFALSLKPDYSKVHYNLGGVYSELGLYQKAIQEWKIALSINPDYELAKKNLEAVRQRERVGNRE